MGVDQQCAAGVPPLEQTYTDAASV